MTDRYDTIVVGVGGVGSATVAELAARGHDVLGVERFDVPHARGSSHGSTRIIRLAYYEHPSYVPLLRRAYERWRDLEAATGRDLLTVTGSLAIGPSGSDVVEGAERACREHNLAYERLAGPAVGERFPGYDLDERFAAVYQPRGGYLASEECVVAHVEHAHGNGATVRARERVLEWEATGSGVSVETDRDSYHADNLVVSAGPWIRELVPELAGYATPERQVLAWFQPAAPGDYEPEAFPVFSMTADGEHYYGFPVHADRPGVKLGRYHHLEEAVDPDEVREPDRRDEQLLREFAETYLPRAAGPTMGLETCLFTNTPDERFVVDTHPAHDNVVIAGGFSGHGFKFTAVLGEVLADLVEGGTDHPIDRFAIDRF